MIIIYVVSSAIGALAIICAEALRQNKKISNESSRKVIHIAHALVVTYWAFIVSYNFIIYAEILFIAVVLVARYFKVLQPLRSVNRRSWGDLFFPLAIIIMALLSPSKWIFAAAMLHLGLADALAAIVGTGAKEGIYHVFGQRKSARGTVTFYVISLAIVFWLIGFTPGGPIISRPIALLFIPLVSTLAENISPYGSDNLTIPLVVIGLLAYF